MLQRIFKKEPEKLKNKKIKKYLQIYTVISNFFEDRSDLIQFIPVSH